MAIPDAFIQFTESSLFDKDETLAANSDVKVASQKAVKTYVQAAIANNAMNAANADKLGGVPAASYALKSDIVIGGGAVLHGAGVVNLTIEQSGNIFTETGGDVLYQLPEAADGLNYKFAVAAGNVLQVAPNGAAVIIVESAVGDAGDILSSSSIGSIIKLTAIGVRWLADGRPAGDWSLGV